MRYTNWGAKAKGKPELAGTKRTVISGRYELEDIVNHSKNIIDLIEVGDYVNGEKIEQITTDSGYKKYYTTGFGLYDEYDNENVIHSILTKEQYEANSYKLGDD